MNFYLICPQYFLLYYIRVVFNRYSVVKIKALTETLASPSIKKCSSSSASSSPLTPSKKCTNERLIIDEVVERVVTMAKSLEIDSTPTSPSKDSTMTSRTTSCKAASSSPNDSGGGGSNTSGASARSWTVAPKLYPINSSLLNPLDNAHSNHLNHHSVAMNDKRVSTSKILLVASQIVDYFLLNFFEQLIRKY